MEAQDTGAASRVAAAATLAQTRRSLSLGRRTAPILASLSVASSTW